MGAYLTGTRDTEVGLQSAQSNREQTHTGVPTQDVPRFTLQGEISKDGHEKNVEQEAFTGQEPKEESLCWPTMAGSTRVRFIKELSLQSPSEASREGTDPILIMDANLFCNAP